MNFTRYRVLTQILLLCTATFILVRRNELHPLQGIDTTYHP